MNALRVTFKLKGTAQPHTSADYGRAKLIPAHSVRQRRSAAHSTTIKAKPHSSRHKVQSTKYKVQSSKLKARLCPSLADNQDHKRAGFHGSCGSLARFSCWSFSVFSRWKKDFLCLRIEGHRFRALLGLHCSGIFVFVSRLFMEDTQGSLTTRKRRSDEILGQTRHSRHPFRLENW